MKLDPVGAAAAAVSNHEAEADPHPGYSTSAETSAAIAAHEAAGDPHPTYQTAAEVATAIGVHEAAADPHAVYQKESEKGAANGYASLDSGGQVPISQIPTTNGVLDSFFGDGSDGIVDFDGTNVFGFASTTGAAPNLVYTLTRDVFATTCTIRASKRLNGGNFKLHASVLGTIEAGGEYAQDGNSAVGGTAGAGIAAGGTLNASSGAGGAGRSTLGLGNAGTGTTSSFAGDGGAGGAGSGGQTGGPGGVAVDSVAAAGRGGSLLYGILSRLILGTAIVSPNGGGGGGGGGVNVAIGTATSGGGGGGGGKLYGAFKELNNLGSIHANGGAGGDAAQTGDGSAGGGGGGGGGEVQLLLGTTTALGTVQANGGAGGAAAGTGAVAGSAGAVGKIFLYS